MLQPKKQNLEKHRREGTEGWLKEGLQSAFGSFAIKNVWSQVGLPRDKLKHQESLLQDT